MHVLFFFNDRATTEIYTYGHTLSLHDALPISTRHHVTIKVGREGTQLLGNRLVATHHPVVAEHRRNGNGETESGHDERLTDRTGDRVDRRLTGGTDLDERAVDADDGAEQADERRGRAPGGEERQTGRQLGVYRSQAAGPRAVHPPFPHHR